VARPRHRAHGPVRQAAFLSGDALGRRLRLAVWQARYVVSEAAAGFRRNGLMTVAAVTTTGVALLVAGAGVLAAANLSHLAEVLEAQVQVVAYLHDGLNDAQTFRVRQAVQGVAGVRGVRFVSRQEALRALRQRLGNSPAFEDLEADNPLPDSLEVSVDDPHRVRQVAAAVAAVPGVADVTYGARVTDRLLALTAVVRVAAAAMTACLAAVALVVVANTIRMTVLARRQELDIMLLVGASRWAVQWPLLVEGMLQGAVAAAGAVLVLLGLYAAVTSRLVSALPFWPVVPPSRVVGLLVATVVSTGVGVGAAGSIVAVRRFIAS
jgi:cell division transport system permease protein